MCIEWFRGRSENGILFKVIGTKGKMNQMHNLRKTFGAILVTLLGIMAIADGQEGQDDARELLDRVRFPTPAGYVLLEKGAPLHEFLDKAEAVDTANEVLARYIRADTLDENGDIKSDANIVEGMLTVKVAHKLKGMKIALSDFRELAAATEQGVRDSCMDGEGARLAAKAAKQQDQALKEIGVEAKTSLGEIGFLGFRQLEKMVMYGIVRTEQFESEGEKTVIYDVLAICMMWCEGNVFCLCRIALVPSKSQVDEAYMKSLFALQDWAESIRAASVVKEQEEFEDARYEVYKLNDVKRKSTWNGRFIDALILALVGSAIGAVLALCKRKKG